MMLRPIHIILGLMVIIFLMAGWMYRQHKQISELERQVPELIALANDSARQARSFRDKNGMLHSQNKLLTIELSNARRLLASEEFAWTKKFEGVQKNLKNLQQTTRIETKIDTVIKIQRDTVQAPGMDQILLDDKYNYVAIDSAGVNLTLKIEVPIKGVVLWQRPHKFWFLKWGNKQYVTEFVCENPLVKITQSEVIQVRRK